MSESLDHVILVGFTAPDENKDGGSRAWRYLMNITGVKKENIHFYESGKNIKSIVRESFIPDKHEESGYRIGNSLCLGSESIGEYRHSLELLSKTGITVRTGYKNVDFTSMGESEMGEWFTTGRYTPKTTTLPDDDEDMDEEDILSGLLNASDDDTEEDEKPDLRTLTEEPVPAPVQNDETIPDPDAPFQSALSEDPDQTTDFDELMSAIGSSQKTREDDHSTSVLLQGSHAPGSISDYDRSDSSQSVEERPVTKSSYPEPHSEPEDDNVPESLFSSMSVPEEVVPETEEEKRSQVAHIPTDDIPDDDMEYVNRMKAENDKAQRRRQREMEEALKQVERDTPPHHRVDEVSARAKSMDRTTNSAIEETYTAEGRRKNYREHLPPDDAKYQETFEDTQKKFGSLHALDDVTGGKDLSYVGGGKGRIILCTAGKGGVGKSVVSSGLAMALSLARAKDVAENPGASTARTWLIESDYNSPQLAVAYRTGRLHLGNVAEIIGPGGGGINNSAVRDAIESNVFIDPDSGVHVLACPPLSNKKSSKEVPFAILLAIKYASDQGDDVIVDHGNLTSGQYSELDQVLSLSLAHRVVLVCNMGCIRETQSALEVLCERDRDSVVPGRPVQSVSLVLNEAGADQFSIAQNELRPFEIINTIPPIDALNPAFLKTADVHLSSAPKEVQKAVIDRCGRMLPSLGYESVRKYFVAKNTNAKKKVGKKSLLDRISDVIVRK